MNTCRPLRIVLVGAGRFGRLHARTWREAGAVIAGVVDIDHELATKVAASVQADPATRIDESYLGRIQADAMVIVSDESTHETYLELGLRNGLAVFVEKPFATSLASARRLAELAESSDLPVVAGHVSRFSVPHQEIRRRIAGGELGQLWMSRFQRDFSRSWFDSFGDRIHPVWESCIHDIDLALYFHQSRPARAYCVQAASAGERAQSQLAAVIEFADGSIANLSSSWGVMNEAPANLAGPLELAGVIASSVSIVAEQGTAAHSEIVSTPVVSTTGSVVQPNPFLWPEDDGRIGGALRSEVAYAMQVCLRQRPNTITPLVDSVRGVAIAEAFVASLQQRQPVDIEVA